MYDIEIYEDKNGKSEIKEYIEQLSKKRDKDSKIKYNKTIAYIRMLSQEGLKLGEPYIKHINNEIWELRPIRNRILFATYYNNKFVLLNIFMKDTNKTPKAEIEKAERLFKDYKERSDKDE